MIKKTIVSPPLEQFLNESLPVVVLSEITQVWLSLLNPVDPPKYIYGLGPVHVTRLRLRKGQPRTIISLAFKAKTGCKAKVVTCN